MGIMPERGIVDFKTDKLKPCICGNKIESYGLAYGSTPYLLHCKGCGKSINDTPYLVTGNDENLFSLWNDHIADKTIDELHKEYDRFKKVQKRKFEYEGYNIYRWYWNSTKPHKRIVKR